MVENSRRALKTLLRWLALPLHDFLSTLGVCLIEVRPLSVFAILLSAVLSWWLYVPIHELLHALGCIITGGKVYRLEIAGIYGASLLRNFFPFISVGSDYSGRLSGFDTGGSDFTFFITDLLPYFLTVFLGVPLLKSISFLKSSSLSKCIFFGLAAPVAYSPFMSFFGDYYEMGSILISRLVPHRMPAVPPDRWRSDDLFRLLDRLSISHTVSHTLDAAVVLCSLLTGMMLAFATYWAGALWSRMFSKCKKKRVL